MDVTKVLGNVGGGNCQFETIIVYIEVLIEINGKLSLCFRREVSNLNTSHASS